MTKEETIFTAIISAIGKVQKLGKSDKNKFDNYDFVSIDKFLTLVNPICAECGLFLHTTQDSVELYQNTNSKGGTSTWARFTFKLTLFHGSGATLEPVKTMVAVPMTGAQSSGSAQSYAIKQYWRALLLIPTGDKDDPDFHSTEPHQSTEPITETSWAKTITQELPATATDKDKAKAVADALIAQWGRKKTVGELSNEWDRRFADKAIPGVERISPDDHKRVVEAYEARMIELEPIKHELDVN